MIKAIIFDFDGTVSNRQVNAYKIFEEYFKPYFKDMSDIEFEAVLQDMMIFDSNGSMKISYRLAPFIKKYEKYLPKDFEEKFTQWYIDYMWKYSTLKSNFIEIIKDLKKNYKVALLSNGASKSQHDKIDYVDIPKYFDEVIVTGDYEFSKPDKRIYEIMADKLGVKCEECLFIGDTFSSDILGAIRANMVPIWIFPISERPADRYKGYRIEKLEEIYKVLEEENKKSS